jgi:hypothetical protein
VGWREWNRPSRTFLRQVGSQNWGFAIYRTIYTVESDTLWRLALAKLEAYIHASVWYDVDCDKPDAKPSKKPLDPEPNRQVSSQLRNLIISDPDKFDSASIGDISTHFADIRKTVGVARVSGVNMRVCLLIDAEVFVG